MTELNLQLTVVKLVSPYKDVRLNTLKQLEPSSINEPIRVALGTVSMDSDPTIQIEIKRLLGSQITPS